MSKKNLLHTLDLPKDLKQLNENQQKVLCWEIRQQLIHTLSKTGGHLASNLGTVELTVALHTVFDLPKDQIVWDVGHQCYTHKILTGRLDRFNTIRQADGLSGFPRPKESVYDAFIAGHASNSISAACGLAKAKTLTGDPHYVIAVVGDGAFTGGMIYEALNNAGRSNDRLMIVLNDNDMSISRNVGSIARYLVEKRTDSRYIHLKDQVEHTLRSIPVIGEGMRDAISYSKALLRQSLYHSNLFEDFGFDYLGPIDGHDVPMLLQVLYRAKALNKPVVVHVNTVKGKGFTHAERDPSRYHGVSKFDRESGEMPSCTKSFSVAFGQKLTALAQKDRRICAITAAMEDGTGLHTFAEQFAAQNRFFDVGIAEQHAVTFASGLAAGGMKPVFAVYSTFLQRGYDQLIHDAAIDRQKIVLAIDRAGIVGDDGETHQGLFDAAYLSQIPGMTVYSPFDFADLDYALERALYHSDGPAALRYPRAGQPEPLDLPAHEPEDWSHFVMGGQLLLISYGRVFGEAVQAAKQLGQKGKKADLLKLHRITPIPDECIALAKKYRSILFIEEGVRMGGIGEHFLLELTRQHYRGQMQIHAIENPFLPQMPVSKALRFCGLDADSLTQKIDKLFF